MKTVFDSSVFSYIVFDSKQISSYWHFIKSSSILSINSRVVFFVFIFFIVRSNPWNLVFSQISPQKKYIWKILLLVRGFQIVFYRVLASGNCWPGAAVYLCEKGNFLKFGFKWGYYFCMQFLCAVLSCGCGVLLFSLIKCPLLFMPFLITPQLIILLSMTWEHLVYT